MNLGTQFPVNGNDVDVRPIFCWLFLSRYMSGEVAEPPKGAGPLKGATPRRGVWRHSRPLLPAGTSATAAPDLAVFLNGVSLFVGEAR